MNTATIAPAAYPRDPTMAEDALLRAHATFQCRPDAVRDARHWLADTLAGWKAPGGDTDTAQLLLSEIATNAVVHACGGDTFRIEAWLWGVELTVSVYDTDPASSLDIPEQRDSAEHGRGLLLLKAMARKCGVDRTDTEKRTWFLLYLGDTEDGAP